jgi:hypothetical protein
MIDKINDEFIVDCNFNTTEERREVYKFLVDNRGYNPSYLKNDYPIIVTYQIAALGEIKLVLSPSKAD